jgi:hypothetical protein
MIRARTASSVGSEFPLVVTLSNTSISVRITLAVCMRPPDLEDAFEIRLLQTLDAINSLQSMS